MQLKLLHVTTRNNASGKVRYYFRRKGQPIIRLPDNPKSPEFMEAYNEALNFASGKYEGSFGWLCDEYQDTVDFKNSAPATVATNRRIIRTILNEPLDPTRPVTFKQERASLINRRHIEILRDRKGDSPHAANKRMIILNQIFKMAISRGFVTSNPVTLVERLKVGRSGHRTATSDHIEQFMAYHTSGPPRLCMVILTNTGVRVSDLRILGKQNVRGNLLIFETVKTKMLCELPITPSLKQAISTCADMTFLLSYWGRPYQSDKSLSQRIAKWFRQAGIEGITAHSVRKWLATRMANAGATEYELMSWFGWRDSKEAKPYIQTANRQKLAGDALRKLG